MTAKQTTQRNGSSTHWTSAQVEKRRSPFAGKEMLKRDEYSQGEVYITVDGYYFKQQIVIVESFFLERAQISALAKFIVMLHSPKPVMA